MVNGVQKSHTVVFHPVYAEHDLVLGIVEDGKRGYFNPAVAFLDGTKFSAALKICADLNLRVFDIGQQAATKIVTKSMQ